MTASVVGSAELPAAAFGLATLLAFLRRYDWSVVVLLALAVLSHGHAGATASRGEQALFR